LSARDLYVDGAPRSLARSDAPRSTTAFYAGAHAPLCDGSGADG